MIRLDYHFIYVKIISQTINQFNYFILNCVFLIRSKSQNCQIFRFSIQKKDSTLMPLFWIIIKTK